MTEFSHELDGLDRQIAHLENEREQWDNDGTTMFVGTAVEYSVYLEFGTRNMDPKPFVRPAVHAYEANLRAAIAADTQTTLEEIDSVDELVQTIAFGLERRIKRIIKKKRLIDTGALRASVQAVETESSLQGLGDVAARADVDLDPADFEEAAA